MKLSHEQIDAAHQVARVTGSDPAKIIAGMQRDADHDGPSTMSTATIWARAHTRDAFARAEALAVEAVGAERYATITARMNAEHEAERRVAEAERKAIAREEVRAGGYMGEELVLSKVGTSALTPAKLRAFEVRQVAAAILAGRSTIHRAGVRTR